MTVGQLVCSMSDFGANCPILGLPGALPVEAVQSVSCASAGSCVAGGSYQGTGRRFSLQGFVT